MSELLWGIDLGGTKIEGVVVKRNALTTALARERIATEQESGYEHILAQINKLLLTLKKQVGASPEIVGFGTPGTIDPDRQTLKNSNTQCLNGKALKADLAKTLGVEVRMTNDANCFALAEARGGAGQGAQCVFGVIMGTGVGGGVVFGGRAWDGAQGNGGEWGHNVLDPDGEACYCGKRGCVEKCISGPALEARYFRSSGTKRTLNEIADAAASGTDAHAVKTIDYLCSRFGQAISVVINILDPQVIVLGGGVSNVQALYTRGREAARQYVFNDRLDTKLVPNQLGDSAGVFGAACLGL